jgi:hypothetical protein
MIGASNAISGVLGIEDAAGMPRLYYWLMLQIVFAIILVLLLQSHNI